MGLSVCYKTSLGPLFLLHLSLELFCSFLDVVEVQVLLVQADFLLASHIGHLVLQEALYLLILAVL